MRRRQMCEYRYVRNRVRVLMMVLSGTGDGRYHRVWTLLYKGHLINLYSPVYITDLLSRIQRLSSVEGRYVQLYHFLLISLAYLNRCILCISDGYLTWLNDVWVYMDKPGFAPPWTVFLLFSYLILNNVNDTFNLHQPVTHVLNPFSDLCCPLSLFC